MLLTGWFQLDQWAKMKECYMNKPNKSLPNFESEKEERTFWENNDASEYFDLSKAEQIALPNLKNQKNDDESGFTGLS